MRDSHAPCWQFALHRMLRLAAVAPGSLFPCNGGAFRARGACNPSAIVKRYLDQPVCLPSVTEFRASPHFAHRRNSEAPTYTVPFFKTYRQWDVKCARRALRPRRPLVHSLCTRDAVVELLQRRKKGMNSWQLGVWPRYSHRVR